MPKKLIQNNENKTSVLQDIGFVLILLGILLMLVVSFFTAAIVSSVLAIAFFITMLGVSFAFPQMLEGNEGLSTMRIVVFMITNVICMLLIKMGWGHAINSLEDIGLDQYWMGVIAFAFGAKATQKFFESKMAVVKDSAKQRMATIGFNKAEIAKLAIIQYDQFLKVKFPNIRSISDAVHNLDQDDSHVIAIYLEDDKSADIPANLEVKMMDGSTQTIATQIIPNVGRVQIQVCQHDTISNGTVEGSVCCIVNARGEKKIVTAGHVLSKRRYLNFGGELDSSQQIPAWLNNQKVGNWFFQINNYKNDVALADINNWQQNLSCISFKDKDHYEVKDADIGRTIVKVVSNKFDPKERTAYILDYNTAWDIVYADGTFTKNNVIVIGSNPDRTKSKTVSNAGDSGGCVYDPVSGNLLGLILGGNTTYTFVLPLKDVFTFFGYQLN